MQKVSPIDIKGGNYYFIEGWSGLWECTHILKKHNLIRMKNILDEYVVKMSDLDVTFYSFFKIDESEYPEYFV